MNKILSEDQLKEFTNNGVLILRSFYDLASEIHPIQEGIYKIITLIIKKYSLDIDQGSFSPETFDNGYNKILAINRAYAAEIYDAVKQIPAFIRLVSSEKHDVILSQLRNTDSPGICAGGYGIRIDNPNEEKFRAPWHQDYLGQFRSVDGLVFWSPLLSVSEDMGPVKFCLGSHKEGLIRVHTKDPNNPDKTGAYALILENENKIINKYEQVAPLTDPGDLVIIDFLNVHCSGYNSSQKSRWTMQMRYFNFNEPTGIKIGWKGAFASGEDIKAIHPELFIE